MSEELYYIDYMNFPILMVDISIVLAYICRIKTTGYTALVLEIPDRSVLEKIIYFFSRFTFLHSNVFPFGGGGVKRM